MHSKQEIQIKQQKITLLVPRLIRKNVQYISVDLAHQKLSL